MREPAGKPAGAYRPDIDGLRAAAIATVVLFHAAPHAFPGGFAGVDVFFVISGYLITGIILREQAEGRFGFASFYARRVKRIFPALALVLAATGIAGWVVLLRGEYLALGRYTAGGAGFVANLLLWRDAGYFDAAAASKPLLHLWSLGVEEQFYLVWPLALASRRGFSAFALAALVALASFIFNLWMLRFDPAGAFYLPFGRFWELMLGAAVAAAPLPPRREAAAWLGAALLVFAFATLDGNQPYPGWRALAPALGTMLLVAAGPQTRIARGLAWPPFVGLGLVSYPLYLWHWPLLSFLARFDAMAEPIRVARWEALAVLAALVLAVATHLVVERAANAQFRRRPRVVVAAAVAAVAATGLAGALHWPPFSDTGQLLSVARLEAFRAAAHADSFRYGRCLLMPGQVADDRKTLANGGCEGDGASGRPKLLLLGDSHGAHLYPGVVETLGARYDIAQLNIGFCVPLVVDLQVLGNAAATQRCKDDNAYIFGRAEALKPALIVVGGNYLAYESRPGFAYPGFDAALLAAVQTLHRSVGAPVLVVGQAPIWRQDLPILVADALRRGGAPPERLAVGLDPETFATDRRLRALPWGEGVSYLSLTDALCGNGACRILTPGEFPNNLIGFDASHFSESGSRFVVRTILAPWIDAHAPR